MSFPFNAQHGVIIVEAELEGPTATVQAHLSLDTSATATLIRTSLLVLAGHDPSQAVSHKTVVTASGSVTAPVVFTKRLASLGQERQGFQVLAHTVPLSAGVDGVLGLDFLRGWTLVIDFRQGLITLS